MKRTLILTMMVTLWAPRAQVASGCDLCAVYAASRARGEEGKGAFAGFAEQFTDFGTLQEDGEEVPNPSGQYMKSSISQVFAGYNLNNHFGLQFNLPVIYRAYKRPDGMGGIDSGTVSGIGDVALVGNLMAFRRLTEDYTFTWNVVGGVKFPTGNTSRLEEEFDEVEDPVGPPSAIHGHDLTLGSGSYDGIVGTGVYGRLDRVFANAAVQYAIRSKGAYEYQFANDLTWWGGPGYYVVLADMYTLGVQAVVSGEYKGLDTFQGAPAEDTGLTGVYLGPQLVFTWSGNLSVQAGVDFPVSMNATALQVVPDYRVRGAVTWHF